VKNVEDCRPVNGLCPLGRASSPCPRDYRPESDVSPELSPTDASYYQSLIGTSRWIVELGRADLVMETSALASMMALPREGHLKALFYMFAFLKRRHNGIMVFDHSESLINETEFKKEEECTRTVGI